MKAINPNIVENGLKAIVYFALILLIPIFSLTFLTPFFRGESFVQSYEGFSLWVAVSVVMWAGLGGLAAKKHGKAALVFYSITVLGYVGLLAIVGLTSL